jgi:hypothetical protein
VMEGKGRERGWMGSLGPRFTLVPNQALIMLRSDAISMVHVVMEHLVILLMDQLSFSVL